MIKNIVPQLKYLLYKGQSSAKTNTMSSLKKLHRALKPVVCISLFCIIGYFFLDSQRNKLTPSDAPILSLLDLEGEKTISYCPVPKLSPQLKNTSWYRIWEEKVKLVNLTNCPKGAKRMCCSRWWNSQPQSQYYPKPPIPYPPAIGKPLTSRPDCAFQINGNERGSMSNCAARLKPVFEELDKLGVVWFIQDGTEMGVVRNSTVMSADEDIDLFVNLPSLKEFREKFGNKTEYREYGSWRSTCLFMKGNGTFSPKDPINLRCNKLHVYILDWMLREMKMEPRFEDTCTCYIDSVPTSCHRDAEHRMFLQFGPTWKIPIPIKNLNNPTVFQNNPGNYRTKNARKVLKAIASSSSSGIISEEEVRKLDPTIEISKDEMPFILAHLNVIKYFIE